MEIGEFPRLAQQLGVRAVPMTVINGRSVIAGAVDEEALVEHVLKAAEGGAAGAKAAQGGATSQTAPEGGGSPDRPPGGGLILPP